MASFEKAKWQIVARESIFGGNSVNPTRVDLARGKQRFALLAYAWKVTGEGRGRSGNNYRIQTTRSHEGDLLMESGRQTVGFGLDADREVIVAFDGWTKRATGRSSSVHIERATLDAAATDGYVEQEPRWDSRAAVTYGHGEELLAWISNQSATRMAAVQPLHCQISEDRAKVIADLWNSAPAAWLRRGDRLVLANREGSALLDRAVWQVLDIEVRTVTKEGRNPRRTVTFTCRRYGRVTTDHEATFLAGLTKRATT
ncbi:hypothetical protein [Arthrobacter crystallopoietes]|uniref:hypothetical protein n=1 Tax=Crystallibacter crystallopoietes TaxID=37928 RepID=UPI001FCDDE0D|nr:hypothetical protein [Arthrobacter crystallopoietes]